MKINKDIFIHVLLLISVNILQFFFNSEIILSSILTSIFLIYSPGFLLFRILNNSDNYSLRAILYSVGLSIFILMLTALVINSSFTYFFNIKPIDKLPIIISMNLILIILIVINLFKKQSKVFFTTQVEKYTIKDRILLLIAICFPIISVCGAIYLNNDGTGKYILLNLYFMGVYIFFLTLQKKIHSSLYPITLYMIALSVLLNLSLRGWLLTGSDIMTEFRMFQMTLERGYWSGSITDHAYNICISITLLPSIFSKLLKVPDYYIFKLIYQFIFAFVPLIVYLFTNKYTNKVWSFLSGIIFISFPIFVNSMPMHLRQEIAFLFFGLLLLSLFDNKFSFVVKTIFQFIFAFAIIISHYSTTFITLSLLSIWFFIDLFLTLFLRFKGNYLKSNINNFSFNPPIYLIAFMYLFSFIWFSQISNLSSNLLSLKDKVIQNISDVHSTDIRVDQTSLANQFNIFYIPEDKKVLLDDYVNRAIAPRNESLFYSQEQFVQYNPILINSSPLVLNVPLKIYDFVVNYSEIIKKLQKIFAIMGVVYLSIVLFRNKFTKLQRNHLVLSVSSLLMLLAFMILPYFTIEYDILRTTQQLLFILSYTTILGLITILNFVKFIGIKWKRIIVSLFILSYFWVYTDSFNQFIGGAIPTVQMNNSGAGYERFMLHSSEKTAIKWLTTNKKEIYLIQADDDSISRIGASTVTDNKTSSSILPADLYRESYVYLNKINSKYGVTYKNYKGESLRYTIPNDFLNNNKDLMYNNRNSKIYQ